MIVLRLQAGPHDGETRRVASTFELPERIYVVHCRQCGSHWYAEPHSAAEVYSRDEEDAKGRLVYVFTDTELGNFRRITETVTPPTEAVPALLGLSGVDRDPIALRKLPVDATPPLDALAQRLVRQPGLDRVRGHVLGVVQIHDFDEEVHSVQPTEAVPA